MGYWVAEVEADADDEDELSGVLWSLGTSGVEFVAAEPRLRARAFFAEALEPGLADRLTQSLAPLGGLLVSLAPQEERDWLENFRSQALPFEVGERFLLDPREVDAVPPDPGGRILLRLPARTAFGTGTHASTALILRWLEGEELIGRSVLDVGAGTGVLAFAARRLGASRAVAFDIDPAGPFAARANAHLNGIDGVANFAGTLDALSADAIFDVACNNVVPEETRPYLSSLAAAVRPGGRAFFSGVLTTEADSWSRELATVGFLEDARSTEAEWTSLRARRSPA
jgi:ribosomal protein L11 methyltransferase